MGQYYINQIVTRKIHLNLVTLVKEIKNTIEEDKQFKIQGVVLSSKDEKYYKLLKKILKFLGKIILEHGLNEQICLLCTSPSPRDGLRSRMPSSA